MGWMSALLGGKAPRSVSCGVGLALLAAAAHGCDTGIDTERQAPPKSTLGADMYGMMCDRIGAAAFTEDLVGASFHSICHASSKQPYGDKVAESVLPPVKGQKAKRARELSVAKLEALAQRRGEIIKALDATFPDIDIPNPTTEDLTDKIRLHDALVTFSQDITKLYEQNPFEASNEPVMPMMTNSFGRLFAALEDNAPAREALMRIAGRQGYRPSNVVMGAVRTLLAYPEMRPLVKAALEVLGPDGTAVPELQQLLTVVKRELLTSRCELCNEPLLTIDGATAQPNRPRTAIEVTSALMLDESERYAPLGGGPMRFISKRDDRGFVIPLGNTPGVSGTVEAPFADADNDGYADVDALGRFVDAAGNPLLVDSPFRVPGRPFGPSNGFDQPAAPIYQYIDTTQTLVGALARDLVPLVDPNKYGADSPTPWLEEHETVMYALSGMHVLAGPREPALFDHEIDAILPAGQPCGSGQPNPITGEPVHCTEYQRFVGEASPIPDLVHALGQVLADPDSDAILQALVILIRDHEPVVARLIGAALKVKEIADQHDELAAAGKEPKAELAYEVPVWDELAQIVSEMAKHEGLFAALLEALADPSMVEVQPQHPKIPDLPAQHFGETLGAFMRFRDKYTYNPDDINGPAINVTDGGKSLKNPHNLVDRKQPLGGDNRSMFERSAQLIYDGNRVKACNKQGATLHTSIVDWPIIGSYDECALFVFDNIGAFYLNSTLPAKHPKRAELEVKAGDLNALLNFVKIFASPDALLEASSGITGLTLHPTPQALNRLLFFGADSQLYGKLPDYDAQNKNTDTAKFVTQSIEPVCGLVCPKNAKGVHVCDKNKTEDVLRVRDYATIFGWERLGFYEYLAPQLKVFAELSCNDAVTTCTKGDYTGETFFLDLVSTLWRHWPDMDHGAYCDHNASPDHPRYCSGAGINHYEPILGEALPSDIMPALNAFAQVAEATTVTIARGPKKGTVVKGTRIVEWLVRILFSQDYAKSVGMKDRAGAASAKWVDGTPQAQLTVFTLVADALHKMDAMFEQSGELERRSKWKRARSQLVDTFLAVEGEGASARFVNDAAPRAMLSALTILRQQLNANCPDRESGQDCTWARSQLSQKLSDTLSRPVFAVVTDVTDKINQHEDARRQLEYFLSYGLLGASGQDALFGMLASLGDLMQLLQADGDFAPIFNAVSNAANPKDDLRGPGAADRTIQVLKAMSDDAYDRYHVLDYILPALVTPLDTGKTPLEVILDAVADVNRVDAAQSTGMLATPLDEQDYRFVMKTVREFFTSETRGFQQLYYIVQNRP